MTDRPLVLVVMGSRTDEQAMIGCFALLEKLEIPYEQTVSSAHRHPEKTRLLAMEAAGRGFMVIIAAAGMAASLPGFMAAYSTLPVIGVPMAGSQLKGIDALYSMVQMPAGVPVATVAIGEHGAKNAALLAARILALSIPEVRQNLERYMQQMVKG